MRDFFMLLFAAALAAAVWYAFAWLSLIRREKQRLGNAYAAAEEDAYHEIKRFYEDKAGTAEAKKIVADIRSGYDEIAPQYRLHALKQLLLQLRKQR